MFLDLLSFIFVFGSYKKMITKPRCQICSSRTGCSHSAGQKQWQDEEILNKVSINGESIDILNPETILSQMKGSEQDNNTMSLTNTTDDKSDFSKCNFCDLMVKDAFLTRHIRDHIARKYVEENASSSKTTSNTYFDNLMPKKETVVVKEELEEVKEEQVKQFLNLMPLTKINDPATFEFRKIKEVSAVSSRSKDGRYSDFTLMIWFAETTGWATTGYLGTHNNYYGKSSERVQIHLVYDALERYYTISGRFYRRSGFSEYETEEGAVPDRICQQEELMTEMKRIFLFFRLSPKEVHKRAMKTIRKGIIIGKTDKDTSISTTSNHAGILEKLKSGKTTTTTSADDDDMPHTYGWS